MIRSSKHKLSFQTIKKTKMLDDTFALFQEDLNWYIDLIIEGKLELTNLVPSSKILPVNKIQGGQYRQIIYNHASQILRSQIKKAHARRFKRYKQVYAKAAKQSRRQEFLSKRFQELKLKPIMQSRFFTKPNLKNMTITLDQRLVDFQTGYHFDEFVSIATPFIKEGSKRNRIIINIPIKQHKHSLKFKDWTRKKSVRLRKVNKEYYLDFIYEKREPSKKTIGSSLGIDQGYKKLLTCSDGKIIGQDMFKLYQKISNKEQGSKAFKRLLHFRDTEINRYCNQLDINSVRQIIIEDLKNVKKNSDMNHKTMNKVQRWSYLKVRNKLERMCDENGVLLITVNPAYTSQTCSCCGTVDKESRQGELYSCLHCGFSEDADINAALNIHRSGAIVPDVQERSFRF